MDYQALKNEIETGPLAGELTGLTDVGITSLLNAPRYTAVAERFITARTILNECGPVAGAAILDKLEAAAAMSSPLKWAMKFLLSDGIDIGATSTRAQIDALAAAGVLTVDESKLLQDMALQPASRAEIAGLGVVTYSDVSRALNGPWEE